MVSCRADVGSTSGVVKETASRGCRDGVPVRRAVRVGVSIVQAVELTFAEEWRCRGRSNRSSVAT